MMDEKKIEYLKKHLEQALLADDYSEVNSCYQELLKFLDATDIPELAQKVSNYNSEHSQMPAQGVLKSADDLKKRMRIAKTKHSTNEKVQICGIAGGLGAMILGCFLVMCGAGIFDSFYNDPIMYGGLAVSIAGGVGILVGTIFAFMKNKSYIVLSECRMEVFKLICDSEDKIKYLENVETIDDTYVGQIDGYDPHGFGIGFLGEWIYIGEWKDSVKSGIGKLISDDMLVVLEGEFKDDQVHGIVDIQWEDGSEWHGEYKNGMPWNGQGKTIITNHIQEGTWKNGVKVQ